MANTRLNGCDSFTIRRIECAFIAMSWLSQFTNEQ